MTTEILAPYEFYTDLNGTALEAGKIYIGVSGFDPETTPVAVFSNQALTVPIAQPVRTIAGIPDAAGTPTEVYTATDYSITVRDANDVLIYTLLTPSLIGTGDMLRVNNLSDVQSTSISLANLGGAAANDVLLRINNLVDVQNAQTSLNNLSGLSTLGGTMTGVLTLANDRTLIDGFDGVGNHWIRTPGPEPLSDAIVIVSQDGLVIDRVGLLPGGTQGLIIEGDGTARFTLGDVEYGDFSEVGATEGSTTTQTGRTRHSSANSGGVAAHNAFYNINGLVGNIQTSGTETLYNTTSDYRLKQAVVPIAYGREKVLKLNPITFTFKTDPNVLIEGFLAHEVQEICPRAVSGEKDGEEHQVMDSSKLVALLTAGLQDALNEITALTQRIETLENAGKS